LQLVPKAQPVPSDHFLSAGPHLKPCGLVYHQLWPWQQPLHDVPEAHDSPSLRHSSLGELDGDALGELDGDSLGLLLGLADGDALGDKLGDKLGEVEGDALGEVDGDALGEVEGDIEGDLEGCELGLLLGLADGDALRDADGNALGELDGDVLGELDGDSLGLLLGLADEDTQAHLHSMSVQGSPGQPHPHLHHLALPFVWSMYPGGHGARMCSIPRRRRAAVLFLSGDKLGDNSSSFSSSFSFSFSSVLTSTGPRSCSFRAEKTGCSRKAFL